MEWYRSEAITPHITGITDITGTRCFLISGSERALLADTGTGAGDLKAYVDGLTKLPYEVALTHGHVDHGGGAWAFDRVRVSPADVELLRAHSALEKRLDFIRASAPDCPPEGELLAAMGRRMPEIDPLEDGMAFDLGGVRVRAVAVPGHTRGMTCLLIEQDRAMLLGDAVNQRVFLFGDESLGVAAYRDSLRKLQTLDPLYDVALYSHGPAVQTRNTVAGCIALAGEILAGADDRVPFEFMGSHAFMAKRLGPDGAHRADGGDGNIVYRA